MHSEIELSTMMVEYTALSTSMRDQINRKRFTEGVCTHMGFLDKNKVDTIEAKTIIH
jgi:hypothetical protein